MRTIMSARLAAGADPRLYNVTDNVRPVPKDLIAKAVRLPLTERRIVCPFRSGTCLYQAEVGRRIINDRYGIPSILLVGDFMRPVGDGLMHTYTHEDGIVSVKTGACHVWLYTRPPAKPQIIDFAAWEAPFGMELAGQQWPGPRPDYLWDTPETIKAQGYIIRPSIEASREVIAEMKTGRDAGFVRTYLKAALRALDDMLAEPNAVAE